MQVFVHKLDVLGTPRTALSHGASQRDCTQGFLLGHLAECVQV